MDNLAMKSILSEVKEIDACFLRSNGVEAHGLLAELTRSLSVVSLCYPAFDMWLSGRVMPGLYSGDRRLLVEARNGVLAGIAIVKDDGLEKKLCCLRVMPKFQGTGLGLRLFDRAFESLRTEKPLLSVSEEQKPRFERLFEYYGFSVEGVAIGYYRPKKLEYSVNGLIGSGFGG